MANDSTMTTRRQFLKITGAIVTMSSMFSWHRFARAELPVWTTIPVQNWIAGQPVFLDLADYVSDADGDSLTFSLDIALPKGVTLNGSIISGTPEAPMEATSYVASADDVSPPSPPTNVLID